MAAIKRVNGFPAIILNSFLPVFRARKWARAQGLDRDCGSVCNLFFGDYLSIGVTFSATKARCAPHTDAPTLGT
jgi:hypothetical protein